MAAAGGRVLVVGFPAQAFARTATSSRRRPARSAWWSTPASGSSVPLDEVLARAPAAAGGRAAHARAHRPHVLGRRRCAALAAYRPTSTPTTATGSPTRSTLGPAADRDVRRRGSSGPSRTTSASWPTAMRSQLAGLDFAVDHAPGHTEGSVMFRSSADGDLARRVCVSGRRAVRRLDRPHRPARRRSSDAMRAALRDKVLPLADETSCCPGHGRATTIGRERATNPYLLELGGGGRSRPERGL